MRHVLPVLCLSIAGLCSACDSAQTVDAHVDPDVPADDAAVIDAGPGDGGSVDTGTADGGGIDAPMDPADGGIDAPVDAPSCPPGCTPPPNATADCAAGACDFRCDTGFVRRGAGCIEALACAPGIVGTTRITTDGNDHLEPAVAVSGDVLAVFWIQGPYGDLTRAVNARFYDYPAMTPRTEVIGVASAPLFRTERIQVVPIATGFAVAYDRIDSTFGGARCAIGVFDRDGVLTDGNSNATGGSCVAFGFAGSDAGFALAYGRAPLDARRFDATGTAVSGTATTRISATGSSFGANHVAFHPARDEYRIAYILPRGGPSDLMSASLSSTGFLGSPDTPVVTGYAFVQSPELVQAGDGYALLFDGSPTSTSFYERYLVPLDADAMPTATPVSLGTAVRGALAAGPYELGVAVGDADDVTLHVRDLTGAAVGAPIEVARGPSHADWPDVAWAGDGFVVAYSDDVAGAGLEDVYVARACPTR